MENQIIFKNFNLVAFRTVIEQALIVDKQLIFEFSAQFLRSCSYSATKSFMKLITTQTKDLCQNISEDSFAIDMYILRGDLFKKFLSVYTSNKVDLYINVTRIDGRLRATNIEIIGESESNELKTTFIMSTEEMLSSKIDDFSTIINGCSPSEDMSCFTLTDIQIQEIKRLIKKLHRSSVDNTAYLTFNVDSESNTIRVFDKVFDIKFKLDSDVKLSDASFNILKSDFVIAGNQTFKIFNSNNDQRIIFGASFGSNIIWCLLCKVSEDFDSFTSSVVDSTIDGLDIDDIDDIF